MIQTRDFLSVSEHLKTIRLDITSHLNLLLLTAIHGQKQLEKLSCVFYEMDTVIHSLPKRVAKDGSGVYKEKPKKGKRKHKSGILEKLSWVVRYFLLHLFFKCHTRSGS